MTEKKLTPGSVLFCCLMISSEEKTVMRDTFASHQYSVIEINRRNDNEREMIDSEIQRTDHKCSEKVTL